MNEKEFIVNSLSEFITVIQNIKQKSVNNFDLLFRGQAKNWELTPKIKRLELESKIKKLGVCENLLLNEFKRNLKSPYFFVKDNEWDLITLSQHFGLPTRFLDWSYSALTALYFSVREQKENIEDSRVYVLVSKRIELWEDWKKYDSPREVDKILIYRPNAITERIKVQESVFTVHPIELEYCSQQNDNFEIISIRIKSPIEIKKQLDDCGVNEYSIYPDLSGLCSYLTWRYF